MALLTRSPVGHGGWRRWTAPTRVGAARRLLDVTLGATLLAVALPVLVLAAVLVLVADGRPVLYRQWRVGEGGRPFQLLKLRTMRAGDGPGVTASGDPRVTRVGALLRRLSVDELPQLWHVVAGQMTLVGPRPESVQLARRYPAAWRSALDPRPGLTGPTQLCFRESSAIPPPGWGVEDWYLQVLLPLRAACDQEYLRRPTLPRTVGYLGRTALLVAGLAHYERPVAPPEAGEADRPSAAQPAKN